jgi:hypothetical protein
MWFWLQENDRDAGGFVSALVPALAVADAAGVFVLAMLFEHGLVALVAGF